MVVIRIDIVNRITEILMIMAVSACLFHSPHAKATALSNLPGISELKVINELWCLNGTPYTGTAVHRSGDRVMVEKKYIDGIWICQRTYYEGGTLKREINYADNGGTYRGICYFFLNKGRGMIKNVYYACIHKGRSSINQKESERT